MIRVLRKEVSKMPITIAEVRKILAEVRKTHYSIEAQEALDDIERALMGYQESYDEGMRKQYSSI